MRQRNRSQSTSSMSSHSGGKGGGGYYTEMIRYIGYLAQRAQRHLVRFWKQRRRRQKRKRERGGVVDDGTDPTSLRPGRRRKRRHRSRERYRREGRTRDDSRNGSAAKRSTSRTRTSGDEELFSGAHDVTLEMLPATADREPAAENCCVPTVPASGTMMLYAPSASPEVSDVDTSSTPRRPRLSVTADSRSLSEDAQQQQQQNVSSHHAVQGQGQGHLGVGLGSFTEQTSACQPIDQTTFKSNISSRS